MNNKQKKALKAKFSDGLGSSGMMVSALSEWCDANQRVCGILCKRFL